MGVPCVRVAREAGEETRQRLAELDIVADGHDIVVEDASIYIPVTDPTAVPDDLAVVDYDAPVRESQTMPADRLDFEPSYERIGEVIVVDEDDPDRAQAIADAIVASDLPVRTVLNRASKIKGETRVRDWEVLAQRDEESERSPTEAVHHADVRACLDLAVAFIETERGDSDYTL